MSNMGTSSDASNVTAGRDANIVRAGRNATNIVVHPGAHYHAGIAGGSNVVEKVVDSFRPSFHAPSNPKEVVLDFGDPHNRTQPQTQEATVLQEILRNDGNECDTRVIAIHGKGGAGKSCILRALARHEKVRERFPDGVYFLSLGMDAGIDKLIQGLVQITVLSGGQEIGKELNGEANLQVILKKVGKWMKGRKCLLLLDDFWERNGLGGWAVRELALMFSSGSGSVVALTTRFISVATRGTEIEIEPQKTTSERAEAILLVHAKFRREEIEDEKTREVFLKLLKLCGGLPLFLSVIGRAVAELCVELKIERRLVWGVYWEIVEGQEEDILLETESDEYPELGKTLRVSLAIHNNGRGKRFRSLSMSGYSLFEMHRALCVFKKQEAIPISVCRVLWNVKSDEVAARIGKGFADVGLGDIDVERVGERRIVFMRLHDLVHVFALKCAKKKSEVSRWHERLLDGYISPSLEVGESVREWWNVEEKSAEGYLFGNICRHLANSGNVKELGELLLSGEWTMLRHRHGGLSAWKHDFSEYLGRKTNAALSESEREIEIGLRMVRDAVVESWAGVHENLHELRFQIFGRLFDCDNEFVGRYLESVKRVQCGPWLKPMQKLWTRPGEGGMVGACNLGDYIQDMAVLKNPFIAAVAVEEEIAVIDLKEMTVLSRCRGHTKRVGKVGISVDGKRVVSLSADCTVRQWDLQCGKEDTNRRIRLGDENSDVTCAAFCLEKSFVVTGSNKGRMKVWNLITGERIGEVLDATETVCCIDVSPNGQTIAAGLHGGELLLWDMQTFPPLGVELKGHSDAIMGIAFSPDSRIVSSISLNGPEICAIRLWDVESRFHIRDLLAYCNRFTYKIVFSEDGLRIVSSHYDGVIMVWDVASGAVIRSWRAHSGPVLGLVVIGDKYTAYVVSGGRDGIVGVWGLHIAATVWVQHDEMVDCVAASPDGRFFVSASWDKTLRTWHAADETAWGAPLVGHEREVTCVAVSPDSQRLVSGSKDLTVRIWDVATGERIGGCDARTQWQCEVCYVQ